MSILVAKGPRPPRTDREFLPAALEILESPPSPLHMSFVWVICALFAGALAWAWFSHIDIIAVAQGKLQPTGRVKLVQPLVVGKISAIHAANGRVVKAGDVLVELEPTEANAEATAAEEEYDALLAEINRRKAAVAIGRRRAVNALTATFASLSGPAPLTPREKAVLDGDLRKLSATVDGLGAQIAQKNAEIARLKATILAEGALISTLEERVRMRETLIKMNAGSRGSLLESIEALQTQKTTLTTQVGQLHESGAAIDVLNGSIRQAYEDFVADNGQKLGEAQRHADEAEQKVLRARARVANMTLRSPITGTVQASSVTTIGQVVNVGEEVMRIVPESSELEVIAYLDNKDIGFVKEGQEAVMKLEAFPFTRYGMIDAKVGQVATDAIPAPDVQQEEADPAKSSRKTMFGGRERTQNLMFPVTLKPAKTAMSVDGQSVPLVAGMAVTVEVRTGRRRVLDYILSPLAEVGSRALKDR